MNYKKEFWGNIVKSSIRFDKEINTVYDLSYFLVDFQAIINNLTEIIYDDLDGKNMLIYESRNAHMEHILNNKQNNALEKRHPLWQEEIEQTINAFLFENRKVADNTLHVGSSLKQTTNRKFNKKHEMNLQIIDFSKGSLVLDIASSLLVTLLTEFLKELLIRQTGNDKAIDININSKNKYIIIDESIIKNIPKNSCIRQVIQIQPGTDIGKLDVQKCISDVIEASQPDDNTEESIRRFLGELIKNELVSEQVIYDERGIKTATRDIERFKGNFIDYRG